MSKVALITGASGMIGGLILQECLSNQQFRQVISLVRKPSGIQHEKLKELVVADFSNYDEIANDLRHIDVVFFCIGVYTGAVPKEQFKKITVDYPVNLAKTLKATSPGVRFCLLSGQGADRTGKSTMMFARFKGQAESEIAALELGGFHAFRPSYIYPVEKRREPNFTYRLTRAMYPFLKLFGKNYSIKSTELARAMVKVGIEGNDLEVLENHQIRNLLEQ